MPYLGQSTQAPTQIERLDHALEQQLSGKAKQYLILSSVFGVFTVIVATIQSILVFTLPGWSIWLSALINCILIVSTAATAWCAGYSGCLYRILIRCHYGEISSQPIQYLVARSGNNIMVAVTSAPGSAPFHSLPNSRC
ncbi:hypothetical protein PMG11_01447 [Penicillium brasilianum]|uniref:Uncharacterized protein n=1 Tax=Penicillium brasilianum TaxID=104259 RepID=A0A0F7TI28_PENBI|nr:hypothetical protein PMG11_01447 [Penicillium brasilianum]